MLQYVHNCACIGTCAVSCKSDDMPTAVKSHAKFIIHIHILCYVQCTHNAVCPSKHIYDCELITGGKGSVTNDVMRS